MSWEQLTELIRSILFTQTGIPNLTGGNILMIGVGLFFLYLAIAKDYEPLLLVPIALYQRLSVVK